VDPALALSEVDTEARLQLDNCYCAGKATDSVLFTSAAPAVASPAEWPPTATALAGDEEVALSDARAEPLGTPDPPVRGASGCECRPTWMMLCCA